MLHCSTAFNHRRTSIAINEIEMSQQLTLSSIFSALALASLCLAAGHGMLGDPVGSTAPSIELSVQAETAPGLHG